MEFVINSLKERKTKWTMVKDVELEEMDIEQTNGQQAPGKYIKVWWAGQIKYIAKNIDHIITVRNKLLKESLFLQDLFKDDFYNGMEIEKIKVCIGTFPTFSFYLFYLICYLCTRALKFLGCFLFWKRISNKDQK